MRILIDTNILIGLEDNKVLDRNFSDFYRYANSNACEVFYHRAVREDFSHDKDLSRRKIIQSKLGKYIPLPHPAEPSQDFIDIVGQKNENDRLDNEQLFQLYTGYVELFVTEDQGLLKRARKVGLKKKALSIKEALVVLRGKLEYTVPKHPVLTNCSMRKIKKRIDELFFDSLRSDYSGFNNWFDKCVQEDRHCYNIVVDGKLSALLVYNIETVEQHQIPDVFENALKMCTFKTDENTFGYKVGELFLNKMFQYCIENNIEYLYLTLYDKFPFLLGLLIKFGFQKREFTNKENKQELIMIKCLKKSAFNRNFKSNIKSHPFYIDSPRVSKYIVPIRQGYYEKLFKDSQMRQRGLFDRERESLNEIEGNSIIKAYLSSPRTTRIEPGSLLFFYSSRKFKSIEPVCILDRATVVTDFEKLLSTVHGKTVFTEKELKNMFEEHSRRLFVMIFRLAYYMKKPVEFKTLGQLKCSTANFITTTKLCESDYLLLKEEGFFNERYIIDQT